MIEHQMRSGVMGLWAAQSFPDRLAATYKSEQITYAQLEEVTCRLANGLIDLGLGKGDRVAVLLRNCIEAIVIPRALERAGLVFVRLGASDTPEEWKYVLEHCDAATVILAGEFVERWQESRSVRRAGRHEIAISSSKHPGLVSYEELLGASSPESPEILVSPEDLISISYTSGTTGQPKGVVSSVGARMNRLRNDALNQDIVITERDVLLSVAPLTHAAGLYSNSYMNHGAKNVILDRFDAEEILATIEREKVTAVFLVATMIVRLVNHADVANYDLSSLKRIYYGASPISAEVLRKAIDIFGGSVFRQQYGMTEHPQPIAFLKPEDHNPDGGEKAERRLHSVGRLAMGVELKIVNGAGKRVRAGNVGEIHVRSDAGMKEYWKDPEATEQTIVDGWIRSGDVGEFDEDGYLYIVDRSKDMIISGGFNIYPREVERALERHPAVYEVCVFGVPDAEWGETVKGAVRLKEGVIVTEEELIEHCKAHLSSYKKPKSIEFRAELPKNSNGKILRRALREPYWAEQTSNI